MTFLSQFHFKGRQEQAATDPSSAIAVTAGAGAGKTLTLVGRYLHLLELGYPLSSILAITFTEKAAREMRSKIRNALVRVSADSTQIHSSEIDSARIGTIHSLCAEILRAYPVESRLDPAFEVLEEGLAAALQAEAIDAALAWAVTDPQSAGLFSCFNESNLRQALATLLARRLDFPLPADAPLTEAGKPEPDLDEIERVRGKFASTLDACLNASLDAPAWINALADLAAGHANSPDDKLELARQEVLARWEEVQTARASRKRDVTLAGLAALRKATSTQGKKDNWDVAGIEIVRAAMIGLRQIYDEHLEFLAGKAYFDLDEQVAALLPALLRLLDETILEYQRRKDEGQSLDFDDLEGLTAKLLDGHPEVRTRLQTELRAVLVDEFQDTNDRQRQIVYGLTGFSPLPLGASQGLFAKELGLRDVTGIDLFIVGDSKQSIYKFRGADVSVFRQVQADIRSSGGLTLDLDLTFRAHKLLLENLNAMLAPILGETDDPARPYAVPFAPLRAYRQTPVRENIQAPFVEFHLGLGVDAGEGRAIAAQALANRLRELHQEEGFAWGEMALLFRASTGFAAYENAFELAGIPFVTVAGRGFFDRPEIRDLLNILAAIADPANELGLVGLLRSPVFAIPDSEIYQLHFSPPPPEALQGRSPYGDNVAKGQGVRAALRGSLIPSHQRASAILNELQALAGRAPAAAVLKRLLDLTGYRALLASVPNGARMLRNVEKLLADAHRSRIFGLPDFLAYIQTLRDVGFREGEAPADATSSGTVQLMTVHKAKGLEFPLVVLADAAYEHRGANSKIQFTPDGLLIDLKDGDFHPTAWQIFMSMENDREDAEDCRLLYVAATRVKEKLIISGHVKRKKDGTLSLAGWLDKFGLDQIQIPGEVSLPQTFPVKETGLTAILYPTSTKTLTDDSQSASVKKVCPLSAEERSRLRADLLEPLATASPMADEKSRLGGSDPPQHVWRVVSKERHPQAPARVVGRLVHEALRRWHFSGDGFEVFLRPFALEAGLTDPAEIHAAIQEAGHMLERFRAHPLYAEIDTAERRHEVPYFLPEDRGIIDLLYRTADGWVIIDFKTDDVRSDEEAHSTIGREGYNRQVVRYARAVAVQLGANTEAGRNVLVKTRLVFLNVDNRLAIYDF